jgi:hypothetical protein
MRTYCLRGDCLPSSAAAPPTPPRDLVCKHSQERMPAVHRLSAATSEGVCLPLVAAISGVWPSSVAVICAPAFRSVTSTAS